MRNESIAKIVAAALLLLAASCAEVQDAHVLPAGTRVIVPADYDRAALDALRVAAGETLARTGRVVELQRPGRLVFTD